MLIDIGPLGIALLLPLLVLAQLPTSPLLEEFGWRGYALPALQWRWTALSSSVALGLIWGLWHLPLMVVYGDPFLPYMLLIVPQTIIFTWLVNSAGGSMVIALLYHASLNTALTALYAGSWSPPQIVLTWLVAIAVTFRYGPRHLAARERVRIP